MAKADHTVCHRDIDRLLAQVEKLQEALRRTQEIAAQALTLTIERASSFVPHSEGGHRA